MKIKTKTILFSSVLVCLFMINSSLGAKAVAAPTMSLLYEDKMEIQELPVKVVIKFEWALGSYQRLQYVYLDWDNDKDITAGLYRVKLVRDIDYVIKRPVELTLVIPKEGIYENSTIYFKIIWAWKPLGGVDRVLEPSKIHQIDIYCDGGIAAEEEEDMILYIILGSIGAVVLIALAVLRTIRRRR